MPKYNDGWKYKKENNFSQEPLLEPRCSSSDTEFNFKQNAIKETCFQTEFCQKNDPKITLNISGSRMVICESLLDKYPNTLLGCKKLRYLHYDKLKDEYFYDRSACAFEGILYFYQSNGRIVVPAFVHVEIFYEELKYYGLVDYIAKDPKCDEALLYLSFADLHITIEENEKNPDELIKKLANLKKIYKRINFFSEEAENDEDNLPKNPYQLSLFLVLERPNRSLLGRFLAYFFLFTVVVSIIVMCVETVIISDIKSSIKVKSILDYTNISFTDLDSLEKNKLIIYIFEVLTNSIFSIEFILRIIATKKENRMQFFKNFNNLIDFFSIAPFWLSFILQIILSFKENYSTDSSIFSYLYVLRILRISRILRVFKLGRYVKALNIIERILVECSYELSLLAMFMAINVVVFSSLMYWIEYSALGPKETPFNSIPDTFWWAVIL